MVSLSKIRNLLIPIQLLLICVMMLSIMQTNTVHAKEEEEKQIEFTTPEDSGFGASYGKFKNEEVDYHIDYLDSTELEERGFIDKMKFWKTIPDDTIGTAYTLLNDLLVNFPFKMIMLFTNIMIFFLNLAYSLNIINELIFEVEDVVASISGISGGQFGSGGIFGGFLTLILSCVAIYTLYQFAVKKAHISSFSGMLKSLVALVLALVILTNYGSIMSGLNNITNEMSSLIVGGNADIAVNESSGEISNESVMTTMEDNVFNNFVHKPYLFLQYGVIDESSIGEDRVQNLLKASQGTEERNELVEKEITESGNEMMTRAKLFDRIAFVALVSGTNFINSIPIGFLTVLLFVFQMWFLVIAMIAPFALIVGALPNQFGVVTRYLLELTIPLFLKLGVSLMALFIFGLTDIMLGTASIVSNVSGSGIMGFVAMSLFQSLFLATMFILRKRIGRIFTLGSEQIGALREQANQALVEPLQKGVQNTATVAGATVGGISGGAQGAMAGANIGSAIGSGVTGQQDAKQAGRSAYMSHLMYERNQDANAKKEEIMQQEQDREAQAQEYQSNLEVMEDNLSSVGLSEETTGRTVEALDEAGIDSISEEEVQENYDSIVEQVGEKGLNDEFPETFAKQVSSKRKAERIRQDENELKESSTSKQGSDSTTNKRSNDSKSTPKSGSTSESTTSNPFVENEQGSVDETFRQPLDNSQHDSGNTGSVDPNYFNDSNQAFNQEEWEVPQTEEAPHPVYSDEPIDSFPEQPMEQQPMEQQPMEQQPMEQQPMEKSTAAPNKYKSKPKS
ncbi:CD3337/EF1877 family mobilome membrane protein, partial [Halobacillus locisalis]